MKVVVLLALQLCLAYCETCPDNKPRSLMQLRSVVAPVEEDIESLTMDQLSDKIMKLEGSLTAIPNMPGLEAARAHISHSIEQCKVVLAKKQEEEKKRKAEEEEMMKKLSISEIEEQIKTLEESLAADNAALAGERKKISDKLETMQTLLVKKKKDEELKTKTSAEVAEEIKKLEGSLSCLLGLLHLPARGSRFRIRSRSCERFSSRSRRKSSNRSPATSCRTRSRSSRRPSTR